MLLVIDNYDSFTYNLVQLLRELDAKVEVARNDALTVDEVLAKKLAFPIDHGIEVLGFPYALGGFLVAVLILSPEALSAARAALSNQLQRSINILLGSVLATISLTIPAVLAIGIVSGERIALGLDGEETVMLIVTLLVSTLTFASGKTNVLQGAVHILLFLAYIMLIFD